MYAPLSNLTSRRRSRQALALSAIGVCVALAACGSSSSGSTASSSTTTAASAASGSTQKGAGRFAALRSCLQQQGITLPQRSGKRPPAGGGLPGGGALPGAGRGIKLPPGVTQTQFQEALKKCGGGNGSGRGRFNSATAKAALTTFSGCMRTNGVNLPAPNLSGSGPVFNTTGINTSSVTFKSAEAKCRADLRGTFGNRTGPGGGSASGGATGS